MSGISHHGRWWIGIGLLVIGWGALSGCSSDWKGKLNPRQLLGRNTESLPLDQAPAQSLVIWHDSWEAAEAASRQSGKPILADFTGSDWCSWCIKLRRDVFETAEFERWASENVVLLELDYPRSGNQAPEIRQQNQRLKQKYQISSYPTVLLLDADGGVLGKLGYQASATAWISQAGDYLERTQLANDFQATDKSGSWQ